MKKSLVGMLILVCVAVLLAGCVQYKSYAVEDDPGNSDEDLIDEIAAIERELNLDQEGLGSDGAAGSGTGLENASAEGEVILPELGEEPEEFVSEEDLDVIAVKENQQVSLKVKVSDPDQDTVSYSFSKPLSKEGEWKTNYGDAGEYVITITATDGVHTTEKRVKLVVERVNVPPAIAPVQDIAVQEGDLVSFEPRLSDPNGDEVSVTISRPLEAGTWQTDHTSAGQYRISVSASNGELVSEAGFLLTVGDVNVLPEVTGLADLTIREGETVRIRPEVSDLDGDELTITISEPVGNDGVWDTGFTDHGVYPITVTVSDGKDRVTRKITLTVEDVNMPPEIIDVSVSS